MNENPVSEEDTDQDVEKSVDEESSVRANFKVVDYEVCKDNEFDHQLTEEGVKVNHDGVNTEEVDTVDLTDCDVYTIRYWNNQKVSEAQEALNHIEEKLKLNFKRNNVKDSDRVFKVFNVESLDDNEIHV